MPRGNSAEVNAEELLGILRVFVTSANWFKYGETASCPVESATLVAHKDLFKGLTALSANVSFTKKTVSAAFKKLADEFHCVQLAENLRDQWVEVMTKRLRMACRHVAKARCHKPRPPPWLEHIDGPMSAADGLARHSELCLTLIILKLIIITIIILLMIIIIMILIMIVIRITIITLLPRPRPRPLPVVVVVVVVLLLLLLLLLLIGAPILMGSLMGLLLQLGLVGLLGLLLLGSLMGLLLLPPAL